jgi:hypothetical protein
LDTHIPPLHLAHIITANPHRHHPPLISRTRETKDNNLLNVSLIIDRHKLYFTKLLAPLLSSIPTTLIISPTATTVNLSQHIHTIMHIIRPPPSTCSLSSL